MTIICDPYGRICAAKRSKLFTNILCCRRCRSYLYYFFFACNLYFPYHWAALLMSFRRLQMFDVVVVGLLFFEYVRHMIRIILCVMCVMTICIYCIGVFAFCIHNLFFLFVIFCFVQKLKRKRIEKYTWEKNENKKKNHTKRPRVCEKRTHVVNVQKANEMDVHVCFVQSFVFWWDFKIWNIMSVRFLSITQLHSFLLARVCIHSHTEHMLDNLCVAVRLFSFYVELINKTQ